MKNWVLMITLVAAPTAAQATGLYQCEPIAPENWLTEAQLTQKVTDQGWTVSRMKKDGGCWEVYGNMPDGTRVEAYFHPETADVLLINQRGRILFQVQD